MVLCHHNRRFCGSKSGKKCGNRPLVPFGNHPFEGIVRPQTISASGQNGWPSESVLVNEPPISRRWPASLESILDVPISTSPTRCPHIESPARVTSSPPSIHAPNVAAAPQFQPIRLIVRDVASLTFSSRSTGPLVGYIYNIYSCMKREQGLENRGIASEHGGGK